FDRFFDVAVLHVLRDEQPILLERTANGESRLEPFHTRESFAESGDQVARLDLPLIRAALGPNRHHAGRESAVFGGERVRLHLDRSDALARQLQIEIPRRWVDEAGAADLKRA